MSVTLAQLEREAMSLPADQRAQLAGKLWDSLAAHQDTEVVMSRQLEHLLDEGLENLDQATTTDDLRRQ